MSNDNLVEEKDPVVLRLVYLVLFYVIWRVIDVLVIGVSVVQTLFVLMAGAPHADIRRLSVQLSRYAQQVSAYMSWSSDEKPYPFAEWPRERSRAGDKANTP